MPRNPFNLRSTKETSEIKDPLIFDCEKSAIVLSTSQQYSDGDNGLVLPTMYQIYGKLISPTGRKQVITLIYSLLEKCTLTV